MHFFDGFRTSHELNTIEMLDDDDLRALVPDELVRAHRERALSPERPFIRGTAQNPDVYFQARETVNPFYARVPDGGAGRDGPSSASAPAAATGSSTTAATPRPSGSWSLMGSGGETARETVAYLQARGERVGVAQVRLYRPFPAQRAGSPRCPRRVRRVAVLDRTKEPGSLGEPLFLDVLAALSEAHADGEREPMPRVIGGRYGLSSKEFTPAMVAGVFDELAREQPRGGSRSASTTTSRGTSLPYDASLDIEPAGHRARGVLRPRAPTARSAPTRTRSRSSATRRTCTRRATSSTTPRSRARRRSRTCASGPGRSAPRTSCRRRASSAAISSG